MIPAVVFPDAVLLVVAYLRAALGGVPVYSQVPEPKPAAFVRVKRIGGTQGSPVTDRPRVDIQCWASSEGAAWDLCALARAHIGVLAGARGESTIYRVREVGGPQNIPDDKTGIDRYAFAVEFSARGTELD
ncbi:hypothetical protein [Streptomyces sp. NPDC007063]|uniref:hypothetical protein n=1 Tax=Streptomyces sp. NPDC007063 TaxID=3364772 RepID=UPI0036A40FC2